MGHSDSYICVVGYMNKYVHVCILFSMLKGYMIVVVAFTKDPENNFTPLS